MAHPNIVWWCFRLGKWTEEACTCQRSTGEEHTHTLQ